MKLLAVLVTYLGVTAGLFGGLVAGVLWLVKADPGATPAPHVAPISPRLAESIERKMAAAPVTPAPAARTEIKVEPEPVKPLMQEADVALTHAPRRVQLRELTSQRPMKRKPARDEHRVVTQEAAATPEVPVARPISTGRTDSPY